ncbi:PEP-CTERM sorting domain-containing protein [Rhodopirellula bahusiensis]|uniref:PEP-CTERM sorting domain-containing protein n=1 Tax=Rhodopirellula bahusiensis TaxID=2014065 RepID=UPI0013044133|nr:PEP-CTERM sorting domain-containing protein [Rhodopirellula bahusiensis]
MFCALRMPSDLLYLIVLETVFMKNKMKMMLPALAILVLSAGAADAAITINIESDPTVYTVGDSVTLRFSAVSDNLVSPDELAGFTLPIDVSQAFPPSGGGTGLPTGISISPVAGDAGDGFGTPALNFAAVQNGINASDTIANFLTLSPIPLSTDVLNPTNLFDVTFGIGAGAVEGIYQVDINTAGAQFAVNPSTAVTVNPGVFLVGPTAVPEPSSLLALGAIGAGVAWRRRRCAGKAVATA